MSRVKQIPPFRLPPARAPRMVGCSKLDTHRDVKDKYGRSVSEWAVQGNSGVASCKFCPNTFINFVKGKKKLIQHSETAKHKKNAKESVSTQMDIRTALGNSEGADEDKEELKSKVQDLEIALSLFLSRHNVPAVASCLTGLLKKYVPDSVIIEKMHLGREKCRYMIQYGIGKVYEKETIEKLKKCDAFGVAFDESEVNKKSEMEVMVKIASKDGGLEARHYKTIDLEAGDATTITNTVLDTFEEDGVDYKAKMTTADTDGCAVMLGCRTGVMTQLKERVPQLQSLGSSNAHNLANSMMHAVTSFDPDMAQALVDLHQDIGGAKGRGLKRQKECKDVAKNIGCEFQPIKRFVSTRFRTLRNCIMPVLKNFPALVTYYKSLKKPSARQKRLQVADLFYLMMI
jgi:hypothetical protein